MAFKLVDDYSGEDLERNHPSLDLRVGVDGWRLYLSDKSKDALFEALQPFIGDAEEITPRPATPKTKGVGKGQSTVETYGYDTGEVRAWAQSNKVKQDNGNPVGDRGRLSQGVYDAYKEANK